MRGIRKLIIGLAIILMSFLLLETHVFAAGNETEQITLTYQAHKDDLELNLLNPTFDGDVFEVNANGTYHPFVEKHPKGVIIKHIPNSVSEHYSFAGWYYEKDGREFILRNNARFFESTEFYAKWNPTPRFINYHLNGGINHLGNPRIYNVDNDIDLENPVKRGYTFAGWYQDEGFNEVIQIVKVEEQGTNNVDVYAKWINNRYTIQYDNNGGAGVIAPSLHIYDEAKTLTPNTFKKTGHRFVGWATSSNGNVEYQDSESVQNLTSVNSETLTLYAKWEINEYTITFESNGGSPLSSITQNFDTLVTAPGDPKKEGNTFVGWYIDKNLTTPYTFTTMPAEDITLYAKWNVNQYTITFNSNGGSIVDPITQDYDTVVDEPAVPIKTGYTFKHWYRDGQVTTPYIFSKIPAENIDLSAAWQINTYTITFANTGNSNINDITQIYGSFIQAPNDPERTGYTFTSWDQEVPTTMPAKDLTITANWKINQYTITFDSDGGTLVDSITQDYKTTITKPSDPTRTGYTFAGWSPVVPTTMPAKNLTIKALWDANVDTSYKVEHYQQDVTGDGYTLKDTDNLTGTTDTEAVATPKTTYTGFSEKTDHAERVKSGNIAPDGSLILKLYYDRETYIVTFEDFDGRNLETQTGIRYGGEATAPDEPTRIGYDFSVWDQEFDVVTKDLTITATYTPSTTTAYKVEHYQQNINDDEYTLKETDNLTGTTLEKTVAEAKPDANFTVQSFSQLEIAPDGSTVVEVYYERNTFEVMFVDRLDQQIGETQIIKFEASATAPDPKIDGYTFTGWDKDFGYITENLTVKATYSANTDTRYNVEHYWQNIKGDVYTVFETDQLSGTTDTNIEVTANTYTGFYENTDHAERVLSGNIAGDGSLVLRLYYNRISYTVTFNDYDGMELEKQSIRHGGEANTPDEPTREGYTFAGWDEDFSNIEGTLTVTATYTPSTTTAYKVEHYQQNIDNDVYELHESEQKTGTTDTTTTEIAKEYTGFVVPVINQETIVPDGSTVVKIYYNRAKREVKFVDYDDTILKTELVKYEGNATAPINLERRAGYTFDTWDKGYSNVTTNLIVKALYTANENTPYKVIHYQQDVTGLDYKVVKTDELTGTTATNTVASANTYIGFIAKSFEQLEISGKGNTVIEILYDREIYNVTFTDHNGAILQESQEVRFDGDAIAPKDPTRDGYVFVSWSPSYKNVKDNLTIKATYSANTDTTYRVKHQQQNINDDGYTVFETVIGSGTTDTTTNETANTYEGFKTGVVTNVNIDGDGNAVVIIKYDRETYEVKFVDHDNAPIGGTQAIRYEGSADAPIDPTRTGYEFKEWDTDFSRIIEPLTVKATYSANTDTTYRVKHQQQNIKDDRYTVFETVIGSGTTDTTTNETANTYEGFKTGVVTNVNIDGDGNAVVIIKYDRETYEVKFFDDDGIKQIGTTQTIRYQASATAPTTNPSRAGYTFTGWDTDFSSITGPLTVKATYNVNTTTKYIVEHHQQNVNDDGYTIIEEEKTGTTDTTTNETANTYEGFKTGVVTNVNIDGDGNAVVIIKYDRKTYEVEFVDHENAVLKTETVRHGANATKPTTDPSRLGYTFAEWQGTYTNVTENLTVTALYTANTTTKYIVEHYQQDVTGTGYSIVSADTETLTGTTATTVTATTKSYTGFTENTTHSSRIVSGVIAGDGSLVLKLYYYRNNYTVTFNGFNDVLLTTQIVRHGGTATAPTAPTVPGYTYDKWDKDFNNITASLTVTATYTANTDTAYKVEHYQQDVTGAGYTLKDTDSLTGTTATTVTATTKSYTEFTENTTHSSRIVSGEVAANGSLVLKRYYDRNTFTVTFEDHDNTVLKTETVRYGGSATPPSNPTRTGYTFSSWSGTYANVTSGCAITATYSVITYDITYVKYRTFENKAELINGFLDDFYDYLGLTSDIDTFKHGADKTSGFDGEWYGNEEYRSKIFGANIKSGNNNYFLSHSTYQTNWKPFTDFMVTFVKVGNPDQDFWSSPFTGNLRMKQYFTNVKPGAAWSDEDMAKIPNKDIFVQCGTTNGTYNVTSYKNLSKPSLSGYNFIGNFISIHGYTFEHQIKQGTTGNKTYYAKFIKRSTVFTDFVTDYKSHYGRAATVETIEANFFADGLPANTNFLTLFSYKSGKWKWLQDCILGISSATNYGFHSNLSDGDHAYWRSNIHAFFNAGTHQYDEWLASIKFNNYLSY